MKYSVRQRAHDDLIADLLDARGVRGEDEIKRFLEPDFVRDSHDPFLLPDMELAVERILHAVKNGEKVAVWSDYDCDGIPGGVMLTEFLRTVGLEVVHYIPHRHLEGFGLNREGLAELVEQKVSLIITVDLGTSEFENIAFAKGKGVEVIVCDHHEPTARSADFGHGDFPAEKSPEDLAPSSSILPPSATLPSAVAVLNPKRADSKYPFRELCGAAVAWKLVQAVLLKHRPEGCAEGKEKWLLDLVGLATLSDMVPLRGENRMLAHFGLVVMRRAKRPGLSALLNILRIKPHTLTEDDIGFMISPRINAASRMDKPETAAQLLSTKSTEEGAKLARALDKINSERKGTVAAIVKEANHRLTEIGNNQPVIVMGNPKWRPGVLGLVANTLAQAHGKPVFLWGREGGEIIRGSVRSPHVSVVELMAVARGAFSEFGGHHASGGFSVKEEKVHELSHMLTRAYHSLKTEHFEQETVLDRELSLEEAPFALKALTTLAPFGVGNEKPLFLFPQVLITRTRTFGKGGDHLELSLERGSSAFSGISFFSNPDSFKRPVEGGMRADIVGNVERDWHGAPRLRVVDVL